MTARRPCVDGFVDTWVHAELRGDVTLLSRLLDDDFVAVEAGRTVDKETWLRATARAASSTTPTSGARSTAQRRQSRRVRRRAARSLQ